MHILAVLIKIFQRKNIVKIQGFYSFLLIFLLLIAF